VEGYRQLTDSTLTASASPNLAGSHECDFPPSYAYLPKLTSSRVRFTSSADVDRQVREELAAGNGLYAVDQDLLSSLKPDVVVTQSLCKVCSVDFCKVQQLVEGMDPQPRLVDTNPTSLGEVLRDIGRVAAALGMEEAGQSVVKQLQGRIDAAVAAAGVLGNDGASPKVAFCEWSDPIFVGGHWTPQLIEMAGGEHPLNPTK